MELPDDVLQIIREYSKPVTHPNWRNRKWICVGDLYKDISRRHCRFIYKFPIYKQFVLHVQNDKFWMDLYYCREEYGSIEGACEHHGIKLKVYHDIMGYRILNV